MVLMLATVAQAQDSQFLFDASGNFLAETAEVSAPPQILGQPQNQVVIPGELASFFVVVADTSGLIYQWQFNGTDISGANSDALLLQNVGATYEGLYSVVLVNGSGSVTSAPAALMLDSRGCGMPDSWQLAYFGNLTNNADGDFDGDGVSNLQEFLDGTNPTNSASALYRIAVFNDGGSVTISPNQASFTNGQIVTLTASPPEAFHDWTGDVLSQSNPVSVAMTTNMTVYARFTPVDFIWNNLAGGDWNAATNWTPNLVPGTNDNAWITNTLTVTVNITTDCGGLILGSSGAESTLTGSGTLTLHGASFWTNGFVTGTGSTVVAPGGVLTLASLGSLTLTSRTLENGGTILCTGAGLLAVGSGLVITNQPGALFDALNAAQIGYQGGGACRFDNAGTFRKEMSPGTTIFGSGVPIYNYGLVDLQSGTLLCDDILLNNGTVSLAAGTTNRLAAGGSATGVFTASATALVEWVAGTFTLNSGAQLNDAGIYRINGATLTFNPDVVVQNLDVFVGTLSGASTVTVSNVMNWSDEGTMSGSGRTLIAPGATLNLTNSGTMLLTSRTLENGGTVLWENASTLGVSGAVITNRAGALFNAQNAAAVIYESGAATRFDNAGTFRKSLNPGTTSFDSAVNFNNYGTVYLQSGTLVCGDSFLNSGTVSLAAGATAQLAGGGSASGTFIALATALVNWTGGIFTLNPGAQLNGTGNYQITSATVAFNTDVTIQNLNLAGTLNGTGAVTVNGMMNWSDEATMSGSGRTLIAPGATLNLTNSGTMLLTSRTLENGGTVLWENASTLGVSGAVITNRAGALFNAQNAAAVVYEGGAATRIDNAGTFRKSLNPGTTSFDSAVNFNNYGTLDIQEGFVAANGGYASGSAALLNCALGGTTAGSGYGQLQVAGTAALNGALSVVLTNGYVPATNDSFTVLTAGTRTGTFASFSYPSNQVTMQFSNTPSSVFVRVTGVAPPVPVLLLPLLSGSNALLTWTAVSNVTYRLEFNPDLTPSNWNVLPGDIIGLSNTASKQDTLVASNRFYRVQVLP
jgi:hypothetical protein